MSPDIIILAAIALFIVLRLRSMLGEDRGLDVRKKPREHTNDNNAADNIKILEPRPATRVEADAPIDLPEHLQPQLAKLQKLDARFTVDGFMRGAEQAMEMVFDAYRDADKETLAMLLSPELCAKFESTIDARSTQQSYDVPTLISIEKATISNITLEGSKACITVQFDTEQMHTHYLADGTPASDQPSDILRNEDAWQFERNMRSTEPGWTITHT